MSGSKNNAPLVPIRPPPPPPGAQGSNKQNVPAKIRSGMNLSKLLPKRMQRNGPSALGPQGSKKSAPPPRPPPPKVAPKQPVLIDLLSGSPPSSPSPTLRSQESGFEESPDVWRSWPDSSNSTPMVDWTVGPTTNSFASADPWDMEWPTSSANQTSSNWAKFDSVQPQRQLSEVRSTTMPTLGSSAPVSGSAAAATIKSAPSMPTIIRGGPPKKLVKKDKVEEILEDEVSLVYSPPMPSFPPPELPADVEDSSSETSSNFVAIALYDYESDHPDDLNFKAGDVIEVLSAVNEDWFTGQCGDRVGHFPSNFVEPQ
ncbi:abl interactor 1-like [Neocloeon triangulifer]|uniref:abl interactor 1-like n=1 Tax=Neocloeon triangulifer TaxID=2078957 RepID=UPI00286F1CD3|nr:abl interactor 1-like [Neocloeon triangulifer]